MSKTVRVIVAVLLLNAAGCCHDCCRSCWRQDNRSTLQLNEGPPPPPVVSAPPAPVTPRAPTGAYGGTGQ